MHLNLLGIENLYLEVHIFNQFTSLVNSLKIRVDYTNCVLLLLQYTEYMVIESTLQMQIRFLLLHKDSFQKKSFSELL